MTLSAVRRQARRWFAPAVLFVAVLAACARPHPVERERAAFDYDHPPLGSREQGSLRAFLDSVADASVRQDAAALDSLVTDPATTRWALRYRAMFAAFDSARYSRGYWLRRGGDTAWAHFAVPHNSCGRAVGVLRDTPVFVVVRNLRSWRLVEAWNPSC